MCSKPEYRKCPELFPTDRPWTEQGMNPLHTLILRPDAAFVEGKEVS